MPDSMISYRYRLVATALAVAATCQGGDSDKSVVIDDYAPVANSITPYADFRLRYESDWDSVNSAGIPRTNRDRLRVRGRVGVKFEPTENWLFDVRARTGDPLSQQSPHLTIHDFDGGPNNDFGGFLDKYYAQYNRDGTSVWLGRNGFPFWKQNEFLWDDDVTITGAAISSSAEFWNGDLAGTAGAFYLPDGGWYLNGRMYAGQLVYSREVGENQITWAKGLYFLDGESGAARLRNGNGARDYAILGNQFQIGREVAGIPVTFGFDTYANLKDYSPIDPDPFTAANFDQDFGYILSVTFGELKEKGDFQVGYYYAHIETFAVNASYAQDDWVRWGSATQTDSSDLKGHEFRLTYRVCPKLDVMARLYDVDAITSVQDGMRFRLDFNYKF